MKLVFVLMMFPAIFFAETLEEWLDKKAWEYEEAKRLLTDSSDLYTYYYIYGKQAAYLEIKAKLVVDTGEEVTRD